MAKSKLKMATCRSMAYMHMFNMLKREERCSLVLTDKSNSPVAAILTAATLSTPDA